MPEKVFEKLNRRILPQWRVCFLAALAVGLLAHIYKITNWLPNWDSLVFRYDPQNMTGLGRWFLPVVCALSSFYDLPFLNGILAIVYHGIGAVCICEILNVKNSVTAFLTGALTVSFPVVASVLMYNYVADGYAIAFVLACMAALLLTGEKPRYAPAVIMITLSVAIYQAYITVTVMLVLLKLTDEIIYGKKDGGFIILKGLRILAAGAFGMILYYAVLRIILKITGTELLDYQGMNSAASGLSVDPAGSLYVIKETFINYFFDFSGGINMFAVLNLAVLVLTVLMYVRDAAKGGVFRSPLKILLLGVIAVALPMGSAVLAFVNSGIDYHGLMLMGYMIFYIFFIILYERDINLQPKGKSARCWTVLGISAVLIFTQILTANIGWHKAQMAYEKSIGTLIRIADRIEQTEGSHGCSEILVVGALEGSEAYSVELPPLLTGITDGSIIRADDETVGQSVVCSALNDYCSKEYSFVSGSEKEKLLKKDEIKQMNTWPRQGCVNVIDGIIVIKLGNTI